MRIPSAVVALSLIALAAVHVAVGQTSTPTIGWQTYSGEYFSFDYPSSMDCCTRSDDGTLLVGVYAEGKPRFAVDFVPGFRNRESIAVQCSALDDLLRDKANEFRQSYEQSDRSRGIRSEWYKTSTTFEGPAPGPYEGRLITISVVVGNGPYKEASRYGVWIIGALRDKGAYLIYGFNSAGQRNGWNMYREFVSRVSMPGKRIPRGSMCSY